MPEKKKANVAPSPSFIQRLLGNRAVMGDDLRAGWPELEQSYAGREIEMPDETSQVNQVREMNWFDKLRNPDAYGVTSPTNVISLNRDMIQRENQNIGDVLAHELTHVGQQNRGMLDSFRQRVTNPSALENEAVNREALRPVRRGDIRLRGPRAPDPRPLPMSQPQPEEESFLDMIERLLQKYQGNQLQPPANITGPRG